MTMAITLSLLGAFVALEAVVALVIGNDRRGITTLARILRILNNIEKMLRSGLPVSIIPS